MVLVTLPTGNNFVTWRGATVSLAAQSFFQNLRGVYLPSSNRQGFISGKFTDPLPTVTQLVQGTTYLFNVATQFQLDSSLVSDVTTALPPDPYDVDGTSPAAGSTVYYVKERIKQLFPTTLTAAFSQGSGTAQYSFDGGATWLPVATTPISVPTNQIVDLRVLRDAAGSPFYATYTYAFS